MADLALRFGRDMLTIASPLAAWLNQAGIESPRDQALTLLVEPETIEEGYRLQMAAGPQCLSTAIAAFTPARLRALGLSEDDGVSLAGASVAAMNAFKPQHGLVALAPCGLPLDPSSKASLVENRDQYARAAALFENHIFDGFLLEGFSSLDDLKCALMGVRKASDALILASVDVTADGAMASGHGSWRDAVEIMAEFGAAVAGFSTLAAPDDASDLVRQGAETLAAMGADLCLMASLEVYRSDDGQVAATRENPYPIPDTMMDTALRLRAAGAQFLRACGQATPAYTGVLSAAVAGLDVVGA